VDDVSISTSVAEFFTHELVLVETLEVTFQ